MYLNGNKSLTAVLAGAVNTNECPIEVSYIDEAGMPGGHSAGNTQQSETTGATPVTICDAPGGGGYSTYRRRVTSIKFYNKDVSAVTVSISTVDATASTTVLNKVILQTLEFLGYDEGRGFYALDKNGAEKVQAAATSSAMSTATEQASIASSMASSVATAVVPASIASTSSQASSLALAVKPASVNSVSSQASSLAGGIVIASVNSVSSQASSLAAAVVPASINSISSNASKLSTASLTDSTFSTVSSAASRVKSSFGW